MIRPALGSVSSVAVTTGPDRRFVPARGRALASGALAACAALLAACSSGLEGEDGNGNTATEQPEQSSNLRFGFDPGLRLTHPITDFDVTGGVLPTSSGSGRPVGFFVFVTAAAADDGDGSGTPLDPEAPQDTNGASDVFVAAVDSGAIDTSAFVYALAGKMRHPRCTTCHQMNVDVVANPNAIPPTAFLTAPDGHPQGTPPLDQTSDRNCAQCHFADWKAPAATFDLRNEPAADLFTRAQIAPTGLAEHFLGDPRVTWALGSGVSPFGNAADDDQDGVAEPEDTDGVIRTVPGGVEDFERRFQDWEAGGLRFDSADALADVALVSRAAGGGRAGNGAAFTPSAVYSPNAAYVHGVSDPALVPVGFLMVAYASDATDMVGGNGNGVTDVFRATLSVFQATDGTIDIAHTAQRLVSADAGGGDANGASTDPDIGGAGTRVAFSSLATDLLATVTPAGNVYVFDGPTNTTLLVSHVPSSSSTAGDGASSNPDLSHDGRVVAFESDASDLVADDTNGVGDVFFASWNTLEVFRASVDSNGTEATGASRNASIFAFPGSSDVRVAFESEADDLVADLPLADSNVFLRDTQSGATLLLNQIVSPEGTKLPRATTTSGAPAPANAFRPAISPLGNAVLFESSAEDLDFVRPQDENRALDVVLVDLLQLDAQGFVLPYALSVGADGGRGNGASTSPRFGAFSPTTQDFPLGLAGFATRATNLGNADPADIDGDGVPDGDNHMLLFLREAASVLAFFEARPATQGQNLEVAFENRSSGKPSTFAWDFGDGGTSTEENPTHVYAAPGFYSVSLQASGELGDDQRVRDDYVRVLGPVGAAFTATKDASSSGAPGQAPAVGVVNTATVVGALDDPAPGAVLRFDFDSAPSSELPDEFEWSLVEVDGTGQPIGNPVTVSSAAVAEDVPVDRTGFFDVVLEATGPGGSGEARQRIEVYQKVEAVSATGSAVVGNAPLNVSFVNQSTGDVASVLWNFGDGATSALNNPSHAFGEGVFDVLLTATGQGGDQDDALPLEIISLGDITANFTANPSEAIASGPVNVSFTNTTDGTLGVPLAFHWDFGNTLTSTLTNPSTSYSLSNAENRQQFSVTLVASTDDPAPVNCLGSPSTECDSLARTVTLFPQVTSDFTFGTSYSSPATRPPHTVDFSSASVVGDGTGTNPSYEWFRSTAGGLTANILFSTAASPSPEFPDPGSYRVMLRVSTDAPAGGRQSDDSPTRIVTVTASRFSDFFSQAVVASGCTSCHSGAFPSGDLDWSGPASSARARIVNVNGSCAGGSVRVVPGNVGSSLVFDLLNNTVTISGCESMRVNLVGTASDHVAVLRSWILDNAPDN